jgi:hypothetical protein
MHTPHQEKVFAGQLPSTGITCGSVREPGSRTLPILVGVCRMERRCVQRLSIRHTRLESRGTRLRAFFAVRKQHTMQVKPVEGVNPQWVSLVGA